MIQELRRRIENIEKILPPLDDYKRPVIIFDTRPGVDPENMIRVEKLKPGTKVIEYVPKAFQNEFPKP